MKTMKKLLVLFLALLMVACFAACSKDEDTGNNDDPTEPPLNMGTPECVHVWGQWEEIEESTCTKKGAEMRSCTLCGKQEKQRTPATGHYFTEGVCSACGRNERACQHQTTESIVIKEPTCTEYGQRNILCTICDAVIGVDQVHPTGHGELTTVVEKEATCTENGRAKMVCTLCGGVDHTYTIHSEGHTDTEWVVIKEPTCTESGHKQRICHTCEEIIDESFPYSTGHQDTEWITVKEPTCTEAGHKQQKCHTCDQIINESFPSSRGHSTEYIGEKKPTCTEGGWYSYYQCTRCDYSEYEDKVRPANGHDNIAGLCNTCGATDPDFVKLEIADIAINGYTVFKPVENVLTVPDAQIDAYQVGITAAEEKTTYSFTAAYTGIYYFWFSELYQGNTIKMYVKDYLGQTVESDTNLSNNEGFSATLKAGQVYTLELITRTCANPGTYTFRIGCQTASADITAYTAVKDSMAFKNQVNYYSFTPEVDGIYRFWFTDMVSGLDVDIHVYNYLNERVGYETSCGNNDSLKLSNLVAGQEYLVKVVYRSGLGEYTMHIGKQMPMVDVSDYNAIHDFMAYNGQKNNYTFTVPANGDYRFEMGNIANNGELELRLYNSLGEQVTYGYCGNGGGFTVTNMVAGEVYTITITYRSGLFDYTLYIYGEKPVVELTDNTGAADSFAYKQQTNTYTFTATEGGDYRIAVTGMTSNVDVGLYIYDANGSLIKSDDWCYNGDYLTLTDLVPGATYTITVYANGVITDYVISVQ